MESLLLQRHGIPGTSTTAMQQTSLSFVCARVINFQQDCLVLSSFWCSPSMYNFGFHKKMYIIGLANWKCSIIGFFIIIYMVVAMLGLDISSTPVHPHPPPGSLSLY